LAADRVPASHRDGRGTRGQERADSQEERLAGRDYSHSIAAGGFNETPYRTRSTPGISATIREEILSRTSCGRRAQAAVIAASLATALITTQELTGPAVVKPTLPVVKSTAKACHSFPLDRRDGSLGHDRSALELVAGGGKTR
jgi:hypothetical protein